MTGLDRPMASRTASVVLSSFRSGRSPIHDSAGHGLMIVATPVIYIVIGFLFTALAAWIYNLVAKWTDVAAE